MHLFGLLAYNWANTEYEGMSCQAIGGGAGSADFGRNNLSLSVSDTCCCALRKRYWCVWRVARLDSRVKYTHMPNMHRLELTDRVTHGHTGYSTTMTFRSSYELASSRRDDQIRAGMASCRCQTSLKNKAEAPAYIHAAESE